MYSTNKKSIITLKDLSFSYNEEKIFENLNLSIPKGALVSLSGVNGAGKSTLLRLLLALLRPNKGKREAHYLRASYVPQKTFLEQSYPMCVIDLLLMGKEKKNEERENIKEIIAFLELKNYLKSPLIKVSGGILQKAYIGRALVRKPDFLILDEAYSYLDKRTRKRLSLFLVHKNKKENLTICFVDHIEESLDINFDLELVLRKKIIYKK